jgi:hypothetical protein
MYGASGIRCILGRVVYYLMCVGTATTVYSLSNNEFTGVILNAANTIAYVTTVSTQAHMLNDMHA